MLNLPTPEAHYEVIKTLPSEEQKEILSSLSERADKVRNRTVEPEEDNMLKITNDGKKLALDQRLINPLLPDNPNSKVNTCIKNIFTIWDKYKEKRLTQLVFCDMSTPKPKPKKKENEIDESEEYDTMQEAEETQEEEKFTVYDDVKDKLVGMGVPEEEIAFIHHFKSDEAKEKLFAKVRTGEIRILMGSTQKMGAGTNVQNKLIALHDLDVPWRPADLEQRAGRIVRQGNENKEVFVYRYVTENTFDSYLWQTIENKQKFISQIMTGKIPIRAAEGIDEDTLNYAEIKALATGDMRIKEKMTLDTEVTKLKMLEANYKSNRYRLEDKVFKIYPEEIAKIEKQIEHTKKDIAAAQLKGENKFTSITINGQEILEKKIAGEKLLEAIKKCSVGDYTVIGNYRGFEIRVNYLFSKNTYGFSLKRAGKHYGEFGNSADGNIVRLDNVIDRLPEHLKRLEENINNTKKQLDNAKAELEKPFDKADELKSKVLRLAELNAILGMGDDISDEYKNKNAKEDKLIEVKKAIIDFCNRECGNNYLYEDFDKLYPDIRHVDVATIMTPNEEHEITYELNLETGSWSQYVGINLISTNEFYGESIDDKLKTIREVLEASKCKELLDVDSEALYEKLGLRMGDDLNFYYDGLGYEYALGDAYCSMVSENNLEL